MDLYTAINEYDKLMTLAKQAEGKRRESGNISIIPDQHRARDTFDTNWTEQDAPPPSPLSITVDKARAGSIEWDKEPASKLLTPLPDEDEPNTVTYWEQHCHHNGIDRMDYEFDEQPDIEYEDPYTLYLKSNGHTPTPVNWQDD